MIKFVADLRASTVDGAAPVDQASTELLIKAVFDPSVQPDITPAAMGQIQTLVAYTILSSEELSDEQLDDLLSEPREIVNEGPVA